MVAGLPGGWLQGGAQLPAGCGNTVIRLLLLNQPDMLLLTTGAGRLCSFVMALRMCTCKCVVFDLVVVHRLCMRHMLSAVCHTLFGVLQEFDLADIMSEQVEDASVLASKEEKMREVRASHHSIPSLADR